MKRLISISVFVVLVSIICFNVPASAISQNFNLTLPSYQGQVELISGYKSTDNDWVYVRVDSIGSGFSRMNIKVQTKEIVWYDCSSTVVCNDDGILNYIGLNTDLDTQDPIRVKAWNYNYSASSAVATGWVDAK